MDKIVELRNSLANYIAYQTRTDFLGTQHRISFSQLLRRRLEGAPPAANFSHRSKDAEVLRRFV